VIDRVLAAAPGDRSRPINPSLGSDVRKRGGSVLPDEPNIGRDDRSRPRLFLERKPIQDRRKGQRDSVEQGGLTGPIAAHEDIEMPVRSDRQRIETPKICQINTI
jgi:hypothetical protein